MKIDKKIILNILVLLVVTFLALQSNDEKVKAVTISNSTSYTLGNTLSGTLTENGNEKNYYKFTVPSSGKIRLTGSAYMTSIYLYIYDENANEVWRKNPYWNSTSEVISVNESVYLTSGVYYFCVGRNLYYGNYNFKLELTSTNETFPEQNGGSNNSIATANVIITNGQSYNAQLALNDEKDFWKFELNTSGKVNFNATFYNMTHVYWKLYDERGVELLSKNPWHNSTTNNINVSEELHLTKGIYYISVSLGSEGGKYQFSLPFLSSNESYTETNGGTNNTIGTASNMSLGKYYTGQIAINDEKDFYKFTVSSSTSIIVKVNSSIEWLYVKLFDSSGTQIWSSSPWRSSTTNIISYTNITALEKGTYYIAIQQGGNSGNYTIGLEYLTQANCPHENYDSSWQNATYFSKGYRLYKCKACGYSYKTDYESVKKLGQGYFYRYCPTGKGSLKLSWFTVNDASGYQIRYSTKKSMKKGVVTKTIKGQKKYKKTIKKLKRKKTYYVQIRAYKKSGKKIVYGKWSGRKKLKTK